MSDERNDGINGRIEDLTQQRPTGSADGGVPDDGTGRCPTCGADRGSKRADDRRDGEGDERPDRRGKSRRVPDERRDEVANRLGMDPAEIAVFTNVDGEYAVVKDGSRLLLQDGGRVAWYGDKAPNPTYPLVRPTVELDESDVEDVEAPAGPSPSDGLPTEALHPDNPDLASPLHPVDAGAQHDALIEAKAEAAAEGKVVEDLAEQKADELKAAAAKAAAEKSDAAKHDTKTDTRLVQGRTNRGK